MSGAENMSANLKRGWAKGQRLDFLNSHVAGYQAALRKGRRSVAVDYRDNVVNLYFARFPWSLPLSEEPTPALDADSPPIEEVLTEEQKEQKARISIHAWLDYRAKKVDKALIRGNPSNDSFSLALENLTGQKKPSKMLAPWQHWSKAHFDEHKADFNEQFKQSGADKRQRAMARQIYTRDPFGKEPVKVQEHHIRAVTEEHAVALQAYEDRKKSPTIDNLGAVAGPILEGIALATGMHVTLLLGGPEPRKGGQLNVLSLHEGVNKAAVPKNWRDANRKEFKKVERLFTQYLETCYSKADQDAHAEPNPTAPPVVCKSDNGGNDDDGEDDNDNDSVIDQSRDGGSVRKRKGPEPSKVKGRKAAKHARKRQKSSPASDSCSDEYSDDSPARPKPSTVVLANGKMHILYIVAPLPSPTPTPTPTPWPCQCHCSAVTARTGDPLPLAPAPPSATTEPTIPDTPAPPAITEPTIPNTLAPAARDDAGMACEGAAIVPDPVVAPSALSETASSVPSPDPRSDVIAPPSPAEPASFASDAWPEWFETAIGSLREAQLGDHWELLLESYLKHEARSNFDNPKGANKALGAKHRPSEVDWWIGRARKRSPPIKDAAAIGKKFWAWWKSLQPSWREATEVSGPLTSAHRIVIGDWAVLEKPGQNGFFSVISVLSWWGIACRVEGSSAPTDSEWLEACADVDWVLRSMLSAPSEM